MKKPPPPLGLDELCDYAAPGAPHVRSALDGLAHFHVAHSDNRYADVFSKQVTEQIPASENPKTRRVFIVLASDPAVVAALIHALEQYLPTIGNEMPEPPVTPKPSIQ